METIIAMFIELLIIAGMKFIEYFIDVILDIIFG